MANGTGPGPQRIDEQRVGPKNAEKSFTAQQQLTNVAESVVVSITFSVRIRKEVLTPRLASIFLGLSYGPTCLAETLNALL